MPRLYAVTDTITRRLPKVISPEGHAVADYVAIGIFAVAGGLLWKTNKRAATAAWMCGGTELLLNLITDYPGGVAGMVSFPAHGKVDLGLAALSAAMPELLSFREGRRFFLIQSGALTALTNLTSFKVARTYRRNYPKRGPRTAQSSRLVTAIGRLTIGRLI
ncbi:MAG: hypothetical protein ACRD2S_07265 [Terriglobales bacterium]